jgi:hypothetical protein
MGIVTEPVVLDGPIGKGGAESQGDCPARNRFHFDRAQYLNFLARLESSGDL